MLRNHLKIALRSLRKDVSTSTINIVGLSVGMCVSLLIGLWVWDEVSYDKFNEHHEQLYQIMLNDHMGDGSINTFSAVPLPLIDVLRSSVPEVKYAAVQDWGWEHGLLVGDHRFSRHGLQVSDDFLRMFTFPLIKGEIGTALKETYSIVLTQRMAEALFGDEDPMGKMVRIDNREDLMVTGVLQDPPQNSSFDFEFLVPFSYYEFSAPWVKDSRDNWQNFAFQGYVELQPGITADQVIPKIRNLVKEHLSGDEVNAEVTLHGMDEWRLYSEFENGVAVGGFIKYVRLFALIGALVLFIACINFMNLSTARTERRAREVGVRKVIGSNRSQLISQFLTESVLMAVLAFVICILLAEVFMPGFNHLTGKHLSIPYSSMPFWILATCLVAITGLLAGSYPSLILSAFSPRTIIKGLGYSGERYRGSMARKFLVITQFALSIALIIGTMVVFLQVRYSMARPSGYNPNLLVMVNTTPDLSRNYTVLKTELISSGEVQAITRSGSPITAVFQHFADIDWPGKQAGDRAVFANVDIGDDYFETTGIRIQEGRAYRHGSIADTVSIIFNASAIKRMGLLNPVGQTVRVFGAPRTIVGVVDDVVMTSPFEPVEPTMYRLNYDWGDAIMFRLDPKVNVHEALGTIERIFQKHNPAYPFAYQFADEQYARKFGEEELTGKLVGIFGMLAIFISCLGLFGLAMYMAERRNKEVGIRKVLGASISSIWMSLSREFFVLVFIACAIAIPVTAVVLKKWLSGYVYHTNLPWWVFVLAGGFAGLLTLITVGYQGIRAALANPVKSLHNE